MFTMYDTNFEHKLNNRFDDHFYQSQKEPIKLRVNDDLHWRPKRYFYFCYWPIGV